MVLAINFSQADPFSEKRFIIEDDISELTFKYRKYKELIVLSAQLNNSTVVNLILDTGCRGTILFGKKFQKYVNSFTSHTIPFSGLGNGLPLIGKVSLDNELKFNGMIGSGITILVVPSRKFFNGIPTIDGVIGYDLLRFFEIEVNPRRSTITFRRPENNSVPDEFVKFNLNDSDILPFLSAQIDAKLHTNNVLPLLIDTGSQLGLLLKSQQLNPNDCEIFARGLSGHIKGIEAYGRAFHIGEVSLTSDFLFSVIPTDREEMLSIGMNFLKDYIFIINTVELYVAFKTAKNKQQKVKSQSPLREIAQEMNLHDDFSPLQ